MVATSLTSVVTRHTTYLEARGWRVVGSAWDRSLIGTDPDVVGVTLYVRPFGSQSRTSLNVIERRAGSVRVRVRAVSIA